MKPAIKAMALDALGVDAICEKVIAGVSLTKIAADLSVSKRVLLRWIDADAVRSASILEARRLAADSFADMAEALLSGAKSGFSLAKAKELAHHYRWRASKSNPREFGDKVDVEVGGTLTVQVVKFADSPVVPE